MEHKTACPDIRSIEFVVLIQCVKLKVNHNISVDYRTINSEVHRMRHSEKLGQTADSRLL